jgi:hypothetical protein
VTENASLKLEIKLISWRTAYLKREEIMAYISDWHCFYDPYLFTVSKDMERPEYHLLTSGYKRKSELSFAVSMILGTIYIVSATAR